MGLLVQFYLIPDFNISDTKVKLIRFAWYLY